MKKFLLSIVIFGISIWASAASATLIIPMYTVSQDGHGKKIGTVKADDTIYGLLLTPKLKDLPPGEHGFHVHEVGLCSNYAMAAGGHLDPDKMKQHRGPYNGDGHLGDLPVLIVDEKGHATLPVLAPRLKLSMIEGRALIIHEGGDNYSDQPQKLGGAGGRIACGVIGYEH